MLATFLILGKFPTEKAYGITTTETIRCLNSAGIAVKVFSIAPDDPVNYPIVEGFKLTHYRENKISKISQRIALSGIGVCSQLAWRLYWHLIKILNKKEFSESSSDLFWIRDILAVKLVPKNSKLVFEIHQKPKKTWTHILKKNHKVEDILIAPISRRIEQAVSQYRLGNRVCYSPMGIRSDQILSDVSIKLFLDRIEKLKAKEFKGLRIGYIGKFSPNGYSKGVEDLLSLAALNKKLNLGFNVTIKGGQHKELQWLKSLMPGYGLEEKDIEISGHVTQGSALAAMSNLDVIVLTNPTSAKYVGFPLKAIESIARGRIVLAAECETFRNIFDSEFQPYWYSTAHAESMLSAIYLALSDLKLNNRILLGRDFSRNFNWEVRTERILAMLLSEQPNFKRT